ncbi:MAG: DUF456 domain-containing protein [Bacteroidota bacterium]|nr:DUF456 domain-containing protein [Bacteroidota bacterium]
MDIVLIVIGAVLLIVGIAGCFVPVIPGPPISYISILLLHFTEAHQFTDKFLIIAALLTIAVTVLDYVVPIWGTKKFGGSKKGVWGSTIGLIIGLFFGPIGIILGPFVGAVIGEMIDGKEFKPALKSGFGAFLGFVAGVIMKLGVSGYLAYYFITKIF